MSQAWSGLEAKLEAPPRVHSGGHDPEPVQYILAIFGSELLHGKCWCLVAPDPLVRSGWRFNSSVELCTGIFRAQKSLAEWTVEDNRFATDA